MLLSTLFAMPVLLFSVPASAKRHGDPKVVAFKGNCKSMSAASGACSTGQQKQAYDALHANCVGIGAKPWSPLVGGFDGGGFHFKYLCYCAHGDTGLPYSIYDPHFDAQATYNSPC